jgi:hypothetical protein
MIRIRAPQDLLAGILLISLGTVGLAYGVNLSMGGKTVLIGPGYLPRMLSWLMLAFGAVLTVQSLMIDGDRLGHVPLWRITTILGSLVIFALTIEAAGLVLATAAQVLVAWLASPKLRWREGLALAVVLSFGSLMLFGYGLGLPFKLWPV